METRVQAAITDKTQLEPKTKRGGKRTRVSDKERIAIIETAQSNPALSPQDIAKIHDVSRPFVHNLLKDNGISKEDVDLFKKNEADLLTALRLRIYKTITDADIEKAPIGSRILAYCQIYDKYRLETGQSTDNQNILVHAISELRQRKRTQDVVLEAETT